ncbi:MAG: hypothetical protein WAU36_18955 [Cyclobacteriaceae bacterium]
MKNIKVTSEEAGILLSKNEKKEIVSGYLHQLIENANHAIDQGVFNENFCLHCILAHAVEQEKFRIEEDDVRIVEKKLRKKGNYKEYSIGRYRFDDYEIDWDCFPSIADFEVERLVDNAIFHAPVNGKFNIDYPFVDVIFEFEVIDAKSVGEILSQISNAYVKVYEWIGDTNIRYLHEIDELVFEESIRIYENGTIEFSVGS